MIDAKDLTGRDLYFLGQASQAFNMPNLGNIVLTGDVAYAINYPHTNGREAVLDLNSHDWMSVYQGQLLDSVTAAVEANIAKEKANPPGGVLARMYAMVGLDPATRHQKLYLKYLSR